MKSEKNHLVIFNTQRQTMGEMIFDHDLFLQADLLPKGEELLGGWLEEWQVQGILHLHPETGSNPSIAVMGEYIPMHNPVFPSALRQWLERHDLYSIILPEEYLDVWNNILQLSLEQNEIYEIGLHLSLCAGTDFDKFKKSLQKIITELEKSHKPAKSPKKTKPFASPVVKKIKPKTKPAKKVKVKIKK